MNKLSLSLIFLTLWALTPFQLQATEGVLPEQIQVFSPNEVIHPSQFGVIVTASGKLMIKPGPVFTEGTDTVGMELPYLMSRPKSISYPSSAISQGLEGKLVVAVEIREDGTVGLYEIMHSSGHTMLDKEAVDAMTTWKFNPAMKEGKPVKTCIQVPIQFQLEEE